MQFARGGSAGLSGSGATLADRSREITDP